MIFLKITNGINYLKNNIYIKNAILLLLDNIIKILAGFVLSVFIARYFGPEKFGQINYVAAFIVILQVFVLFGFDSIVLKDIGLALYPEPVILGTVIKIRLLLAGIVYSAGLVIFYFFFDKSFVFIYVILGTQLFTYSLYILKQWYQVKSLNKYTVIASQISFFAVSIAKIILILAAKDVVWYAVILTGGTFIEAGMLFLFYKKRPGNSSLGQFDITYCKQLIKASLPLLFSSLAIIIYIKIDQIMIGKMLSARDLGIYSIGVTISEMIYFVPMAIANAVYPRIAQAKKDGKDYEGIIVKTGSLNIAVCLVFAICCTLFAPFLITAIYGGAYMAAGQVIQIHSWAGIFVSIGVSHGCYLFFNDLQKYSLYSTLIGAIINILGNFICIPLFGINGAAITTILSQSIAGYFIYPFFKDKSTFILRTRSLFFRW
ncbi:O-unit flippase [Spirochaetia bacterium]|nr:O-unit flippase [Spirochaetia bacterium]